MKKVLAVSLAIVTLLASLATTTSFAVQTNHTQTTALDEWDTTSTETGSLTIYQKQMDSDHWYMRGTTTTGKTGQTGDGLPNAALPGGNSEIAKPLGGVEYTIYQMLAYTGTGAISPDENTLTVEEAATRVTNNDYLLTRTGVTKFFTDDNGEYGSLKFDNLPLGCYYVVETGHPDNVDIITEPFLVDIPMVNPNGNEWNYDVNVYPKNQTVYGSITLTKKDSISGTNLSGAVFKLQYAVTENNVTTWYDVMTDSDTETDSDGTIVPTTVQVPVTATTNSSGQISISSLPGNCTYRFVELSAPSGYVFDPTKMSNEVTIDEDHKTNSVIVYNSKPTITKKVTSQDVATTLAGSNYYKHTTANIGQDVYFMITIKVPEEIKRMDTFAVVDTLDAGLSFTGEDAGFDEIKTMFFDKDGQSINIGRSAIESIVTPYEGNAQKARFNFNCAKLDDEALVSTIQLVYKAHLNTDAHIGSTPPAYVSNYNNCKILYDVDLDDTIDNIQENPDPTPPEVHTGGYLFTKVNADGQPLAGAKFKVYANRTDALNGTNALTVYVENEEGELVAVDEIESGANGQIKFVGLKYGDVDDNPYGYYDNNNHLILTQSTYYLVETQAPPTVGGQTYNKLTAPIAISINYHSHLTSQKNIINRLSFDLPLTGGVGTLVFTFSGLAVMGLAVVLFVAFKKKSSKKS